MSVDYTRLIAGFKQAFPGVEPSHLVRVPGRVNLIGEHLDYNGLPVLPMAIDREIRLVVGARPDGDAVEIRNVSPQFPPRSFPLAAPIPPYERGDWGNYVKAGAQGVLKLVAERVEPAAALHGYAALVDSDLPAAAGLSSSSALVVASALATLASNGLAVHRRELADRMAVAETYVGTMGGGMDHAAILLSDPAAALMIDFFPLRTTSVPLPAGYSVVICNTMVAAPKTAEARRHFNRLPVECRMAAMILRKTLAARHEAVAAADRVADLLAHVPAPELLALAERVLGETRWGKQNTAAALGISVAELEERFLTMRDGDVMPEPEEGFLLVQRMRHVISEGRRVRASAEVLLKGEADRFGALMCDSHTSCRDHFRISCPELEELVTAAMASGAAGARLTGAGFGGCCVALVPTDRVDDFCARVTDRYYEDYLKRTHPALYAEVGRRGYKNVMLVGAALGGASVLPISGNAVALESGEADIATA